jgi:hypothetical protein
MTMTAERELDFPPSLPRDVDAPLHDFLPWIPEEGELEKCEAK